MDWIRMDFGWIVSLWWTLLDGLDRPSQIQLDPIAKKGNLCMPTSPLKKPHDNIAYLFLQAH